MVLLRKAVLVGNLFIVTDVAEFIKLDNIESIIANLDPRQNVSAPSSVQTRDLSVVDARGASRPIDLDLCWSRLPTPVLQELLSWPRALRSLRCRVPGRVVSAMPPESYDLDTSDVRGFKM